MSFREFLTKVALVFGFITYWVLGFYDWLFGSWGMLGATALCAVLMVISFIRDSYMQSPYGRPVLTYGWIFVLGWVPALIVICGVVPALGGDGPLSLGFWGATAAAFLGATIVKAITLFAEGVVALTWPTVSTAANELLSDLRGDRSDSPSHWR